MKKILFPLLMLLHVAQAQNGDIFTTIQNDTVTIWHENLIHHCGAIFYQEVQVSDFQIVIMEIDTGDVALCGDCIYDFSVTIGNLTPGFYNADIFLIEAIDYVLSDTIYIGFTSFTIEEDQTDSAVVISKYQSPCTSYGAVDDELFNPDVFELYPNYPNPFNPITTVDYYSPINGLINLIVYDISGRKVQTLLNKEVAAGMHSVSWNADNMPSGIYFIKMSIGNVNKSQKALLFK